MRRSIPGWSSLLTLPLLLLSLTGSSLARQNSRPQKPQAVQSEEQEDYFSKWLNQDVVYIIAPDERAVFAKLSTDQEREQFIEQFWHRRNPDLRTASNEFKEEHYRRLAYANEHFTSGTDGWKTDRGKVYIIHGKPVEITSYKPGAAYDRPSNEGGGFTRTVGHEVWRYHHIEGLGNDIEVEFVDPSGSGEYRLARTPWEKDSFLFFGTSALTTAESMGLASRADHPYFSPATADTYPGMHMTRKDQPFERYEQLVKITRPTELKYDDLKELVNVNIAYENLSFRVRPDYFRLNEESVLVPLTVEVDNKELSFVEENGVYVARVAIYGVVTSMSNRLIAEFEHDLLVSYKPADLEQGRLGRALYQKVLNLESRGRYKVDLIVKDLNSGSVGVTRTGLIPPPVASDKLESSSVILSDYIVEMEEISTDPNEMFVIGDMKVRPNLTDAFYTGQLVGAYFHLYNVALDQTTLKPDLQVVYRIMRDGRQVKYWKDADGRSIQFSSGRRVVLIKPLSLAKLEPGQYQVVIDVTDNLTQKSLSVKEKFQVRGLPVVAQTGG